MSAFAVAAAAPPALGERREAANVAVASNFLAAAKAITAAFEAQTGHQVVLSSGSTGQLFAQITHAAPYDVFLAADTARPHQAMEDGLAVAGSAFTYATGKLVLWSADPALVRGRGTLKGRAFRRLAIANPVTAPYGAAAVQTLDRLSVGDAVADRLVTGSNVMQAYQFVRTGNADLGLLAASVVRTGPSGSLWVVDPHLYEPIRQDAVLLLRGADNPAARAFFDYLAQEATPLIAEHGYAPGGS